MCLVVLGAQHPVEEAAGALMHFAQKHAGGRVPIPLTQDADAPAVGQHKARDVERVGACVLAAAAGLAAVDIAAGIAAQVFEPAHVRAQRRLGRGLKHMPLP